jgi:hypothetical protein
MASMITAIVNFDLPENMTAEQAREMFEASAPRYETVPGLIRKYYLYDASTHTGGGVYLWKDRASADELYEGGWRESIRERFGSDPRVAWFDTPVVVDNS